MKSRVIKRTRVPEEDVQPMSFERIENRRLARERIQIDDSERPMQEPPRPVLGTEATSMQEETVLIDANEFEADFPLSEDQEREQERRAAELEAERKAAEPTTRTLSEEEIEEMKAAWREEADAEWAERLETAEQEAEKRGFQAGFEAAEREMQQVLHDQTRAFAEDAHRLDEAWTAFLEQAEPLMSELALHVATSMLDAPLPDEARGAARTAIAEAIEQLATDAPLHVTMHPVDYLRLQEDGFIEQMESLQTKLRWDADPELDEGDWIVASPSATIRRVREEMIERLYERLGLSAS